jgi:hypothetical protein
MPLIEQRAIRPNWQTTPVKSLVIRGILLNCWIPAAASPRMGLSGAGMTVFLAIGLFGLKFRVEERAIDAI